jgi:drug/metabolite transporter (DMT)-like permease
MTQLIHSAPASKARIALALATVYLIWGSTYLAIRIAIGGLPPFLMASVRFLIAGAILYAWARFRGAARPELRHWLPAAIVGATLLLGGNGGVVWAEQRLDSGLAALIISIEPLWIVLLTWMRSRRERPSARVWTGLALGFAGLALLLRPSPAHRLDLLAAGVVIAASVSWAWGSLYGQRAKLPSSPALATGMQMLSGSALLGLAGLANGELGRFEPARVTAGSLAALAYLVVFGAIVAYTAYVFLLRNAPPVLVSTYAYVNPLVAVFLGWAVAGEKITVATLGAAAVILAGVALIATASGKPTPAPESEREEPYGFSSSGLTSGSKRRPAASTALRKSATSVS